MLPLFFVVFQNILSMIENFTVLFNLTLRGLDEAMMDFAVTDFPQPDSPTIASA